MTQSKKAGVVENVVAAIILMFIMVIGGLVYMGKFSSETVVNAGVKQHVYSDDLNINNLKKGFSWHLSTSKEQSIYPKISHLTAVSLFLLARKAVKATMLGLSFAKPQIR